MSRASTNNIQIVEAVTSVQNKVGDVVVYPNDMPRRTLTNASVSGSTDLDYYLYESFIFTLTGSTTLTESNFYDKVFIMSIIGNFSLTYPAGWSTYISGEYDGTVNNIFTVWRISSGVYKVQITQPD